MEAWVAKAAATPEAEAVLPVARAVAVVPWEAWRAEPREASVAATAAEAAGLRRGSR